MAAENSEPRPVPEAVQRAQTILGDSEVTLPNIQQKLSPEAMSGVQSSFRTMMTKYAQHQAANITDMVCKQKQEKMESLAQFMLDPTGSSSGMGEAEERSCVRFVWLTEKQLAATLNSKEQAQKLIDSGEFRCKPHECPELADQGVVQYLYRP